MTATLLAQLGIGQLFAVVPDAVVVGSAVSGRVVAWNPAATDLLEYDAAEAVGLELALLVPPRLREAHLSGLAAYAVGRGGGLVASRAPVEVPALTRSGREVWVELRLAALPDAPSGYVVAVMRDISARRLAEQDREAALRASELARTSLRELVDALSHDVRSPLSAVQLALDMLDTRGERMAPDQRTQVLRGARTATLLALGLVDDLLQISRLEHGSLQPATEVLDVADVTREAMGSVTVPAQVQVPDGLLVRADRRILLRVLVNLLSNAGKYGAPPVSVEARRDGDTVSVAVSDRGPGVPPDVRDVIFERFTRSEQARRTAPGLGLGLAIVAGLAEVSGGTVRYADRPGGGASFVVDLPAAEGFRREPH